MRYACALALLSESWRDLMYCLRRTRERVRSLAMLSEYPETDAAPCLFITRTDRRVCCWRSASLQLTALATVCKRAARSVELIVANYVIRKPHPTQER